MGERFVIVVGIVIVALLAGCVTEDGSNALHVSSEDGPPSEMDLSISSPEAFNLSADGEVGQHVWLCLVEMCVPGPQTRAPENVHQLSLGPGDFEGGEVTVTWSPETPLSETLRVYVLLREAACEEACWNDVAQASGPSPLDLEVPRESLADTSLVANQTFAFVVAPTTNVEDQPVEVLIKSGQTFHLDAVLWLSPRAEP